MNLPVTLLQEEHISEIIELLQRVYKRAYSIRWMYDPVCLRQKIINKEFIFIGVLAESGLQAMLALSFANSAKTVLEISTLCTNPTLRGVASALILRKIVQYAKKVANNLLPSNGQMSLLSKPVTSHTLTQRLQQGFTFKTTGLLLNTLPNERELNKLYLHKAELLACDFNALTLTRNSQIISVYVYNSLRHSIDICLPECLQEIITRVYRQLEMKVNYVDILARDTEVAVINTFYYMHNSCCKLEVIVAGAAVFAELLTKINYALTEEIRVVHVLLPITRVSKELVMNLLNFGFVFAAIIPGYYAIREDALFLQYLNGIRPSLLQGSLLCPFAQWLLSEISKTML